MPKKSKIDTFKNALDSNRIRALGNNVFYAKDYNVQIVVDEETGIASVYKLKTDKNLLNFLYSLGADKIEKEMELITKIDLTEPPEEQ